MVCCGVCIHSCCCGGQLLNKCFDCLTNGRCCQPSSCCGEKEVPLDDDEDMDEDTFYSASNQPGWGHQGTLTLDSGYSGSNPALTYNTPVSHVLRQNSAAVSSITGIPPTRSTRGPSSSRPTSPQPRGLEGGAPLPRSSSKSRINTSAATLTRNYRTTSPPRPFYVLSQHGRLLPQDLEQTRVTIRNDGAVHYQSGIAGAAERQFEDLEGEDDANVRVHEPTSAPPPSRAASLAALHPAELEAAGIGVKQTL